METRKVKQRQWGQTCRSPNYISLPPLVRPLQSQQQGAVCIESDVLETPMAQREGVN